MKHDAHDKGSVGLFTWINAGLQVGDLGGAAYDDFTVNGKGIPGDKIAVEPEAKLVMTWAALKR